MGGGPLNGGKKIGDAVISLVPYSLKSRSIIEEELRGYREKLWVKLKTKNQKGKSQVPISHPWQSRHPRKN